MPGGGFGKGYKMSESRKTGLLRLRHLSEVTEAKAEELAIERGRFHRLAREDSAPRVVSSFNLFQTPAAIADRMVAAAGDLKRVLEPSAGLGRIYQAIRRAGSAPVVLVEESAELCGELWRLIDNDTGARLVSGDFLTMGADRLGLFDTVVMNPPFKMGLDIKHIEHALGLLAPGGRLVSLCYDGARQNEKLRPLCDTWEVLPTGSFSSEGTRAGVVMIAINT